VLHFDETSGVALDAQFPTPVFRTNSLPTRLRASSAAATIRAREVSISALAVARPALAPARSSRLAHDRVMASP
jgi:hypothetical protein